ASGNARFYVTERVQRTVLSEFAAGREPAGLLGNQPTHLAVIGDALSSGRASLELDPVPHARVDVHVEPVVDLRNLPVVGGIRPQIVDGHRELVLLHVEQPADRVSATAG